MTDTNPAPQPLNLDALQRSVSGGWFLTSEEGAALLAEVEALRTERDGLAAVIEQVRAACAKPLAVRLAGSTTADAAAAGIAAGIGRLLSAAPSDALAEVKREAWDEGAQAVRDRMEEYGDRAMDDPDNPYAAIREGK